MLTVMLKTIHNTDNDTQIPDVNDKVIVTGNDTVEIPTDLVLSPNMTEKIGRTQ